MLELFRSTGILSDDIETFIDFLGPQYKESKPFFTKSKEKMYLVHENDDHNESSYYHGRIYILSADGVIGLLTYDCLRNPNILTLSDIQCKDPAYYGLGIGTAIMRYIQEYAIAEKIILIKGILSQYDIDNNRERLMNFYAKHDFNVDFYHREVKKIISYT